jgi:hypothetical protein
VIRAERVRNNAGYMQAAGFRQRRHFFCDKVRRRVGTCLAPPSLGWKKQKPTPSSTAHRKTPNPKCSLLCCVGTSQALHHTLARVSWTTTYISRRGGIHAAALTVPIPIPPLPLPLPQKQKIQNPKKTSDHRGLQPKDEEAEPAAADDVGPQHDDGRAVTPLPGVTILVTWAVPAVVNWMWYRLSSTGCVLTRNNNVRESANPTHRTC